MSPVAALTESAGTLSVFASSGVICEMVYPSGIVTVFTRPCPPLSALMMSLHGVPCLSRYVPGLMLRSPPTMRPYKRKSLG